MSEISDRHSIAVVIMAKDCPDRLDLCLKHLMWADEIIVADASTNQNISNLLKSKYSAVKYIYDNTRDTRIRLQNIISLIKSDFIFRIDTDEVVTEECATEILQALKKPCSYNGFYVPQTTSICGVWWPNNQKSLRLFRKDRFMWPMRNIHENPEVEGLVKTLTMPYKHYQCLVLGPDVVKHFSYEGENAKQMSDSMLEKLSLDRLSKVGLFWNVLVTWLRINVRFGKILIAHRNLGFAGLWLAYAHVFREIARHVCPTEEFRMRKGIIPRDFGGYY